MRSVKFSTRLTLNSNFASATPRAVANAIFQRPFSTSNLSWTGLDPKSLGSGSKTSKASSSQAHKLQNLVDGRWTQTSAYWDLVDPLNGQNSSNFVKMPDTQPNDAELGPFIASLSKVPKSGKHNPFKNPERYKLYAEVSHQAARMLDLPEVEDHFITCIQKVMPKSRTQAFNEVYVSKIFLKTFAGDAVRFMARGFNVAGDHLGQMSSGFRWPFGATAIICPFNFPFEIPVLQLMGCLFMGNKPVIKGSEKTSLVLEEYIRLLHFCGMPKEDVDLIHCHGETMEKLILDRKAGIRLTQFTGSSAVANRIAEKTQGRVKVEDAGFDWKILGPDAAKENVEYIAWVCDQDAYAMSGQKCSAQSILFAHSNYVKVGVFDHIKKLAERRSLKDETISPVLSVTNQRMNQHVENLLKLKGAKVLFGGKELSTKEQHAIPQKYGSYLPTAVFVPLDSILGSDDAFKLCTTEIFGPMQVVTEYGDGDVSKVIECCERMDHHLTAAVVSNDQKFLHKILGNTVNGTTYAGLRARTTGAPSNHWFGPCGDPRGAGIGTPEAIKLVWSSHREIITDYLIPDNFNLPKAT